MGGNDARTGRKLIRSVRIGVICVTGNLASEGFGGRRYRLEHWKLRNKWRDAVMQGFFGVF